MANSETTGTQETDMNHRFVTLPPPRAELVYELSARALETVLTNRAARADGFAPRSEAINPRHRAHN